MKLKQKLIMDGIMLVILIVLMDYSLTGGLMHELLGIAILAGFIIHVAVNRKYYGAVLKAIRNDEISFKSRAAIMINTILPIAAILMLISSLAISQYLFPGMTALFSSDLWMPIHIVCAVVLLISVFIHVCMHAKLISSFIGKYTENSALLKMKSAGMRVMAFLFALLVVKSSFSSMADAASLLPSADRDQTEFNQGGNKQNNELITEENDTSDQDGYMIEIEPEPEPAETVSLEEYLGSLFCSGCGRHCSLMAPRCGKGEHQASQAAVEFYETNSGQSI